MRPSLRFLMVAVLGWTGVRAASFGVLPGAELFRIERSEAKVPPLAATQFPPIPPVEPAAFEPPPMGLIPQAAGAPQRVMVPVYYAASTSVPAGPAGGGIGGVLPEPRPQFYSPIPALDEWPLSRIAATSMPPMRSTVAAPAQSVPLVQPNQIDRLQLSTWALLRNRQGGLVAGPTSFANGGTLGASQAGARLTYNVTRQIAATLRTSSEVGRRGGEVAAGVRVQPLTSLPVWLTAERRQRLGRYGGGRNAFAVFLEGGVYQRPMPWNFSLDAYFQGGVVGLHRRDRFVDGALTITRPAYKQFSAGFGVWGGAQPGVYRVDAGPRVSMRVRSNVRVHFDWRQRLAGNAQPGSGPAVTLAGDF